MATIHSYAETIWSYFTFESAHQLSPRLFSTVSLCAEAPEAIDASDAPHYWSTLIQANTIMQRCKKHLESASPPQAEHVIAEAQWRSEDAMLQTAFDNLLEKTSPPQLPEHIHSRYRHAPTTVLGIRNHCNDCWAISLFQLLCNIPALTPLVENTPLEHLARSYAYESTQNRPYAAIDSLQLRHTYHTLSPELSDNPHVQEDAIEALNVLLTRLDSTTSPLFHRRLFRRYYDIDTASQQNEGFDEDAPDRRTTEFTDCLLTPRLPSRERCTLEECLAPMFSNSYTRLNDPLRLDSGEQLHPRKEETIFPDPPEHLLIAPSRFIPEMTPSGSFTPKKTTTKLHVPLTYTIPSEATNSESATQYTLQGAILHHGGSLHHGHYTSCVFARGTWIHCNDAEVTPIDTNRLRTLAQDAYLLYYAQSDPAEAPDPPQERHIDTKDLYLKPVCFQCDTIIALCERFENKPLHTFLQLPPELQNELSYYAWLSSGQPNIPEYGRRLLLSRPETLLEITKPYLFYHGDNLIEQLIYKQIFRRENQANPVTMDMHIFKTQLTKDELTDRELTGLLDRKNEKTKERLAYEAWKALGAPDDCEHNMGEKALRSSPRVILKKEDV